MASITLIGTLLDPSSKIAIGDEIRFTHKSTTGSTIKSAQSLFKIGVSGTYVIELQYGLIFVEYKDSVASQFSNLGVVTVNQDSTAATLPELLSAVVPPTDEQLIEFQAILADCVSQVTLATTQAVRSEAAASVSEAFANQLTTTELIDSTSTYAADVNLGTSGFTTSGDGGNGSWKQNGTTGQTPSRSPAQLGDALLNDGNGNQWAMLLSNDFEFETFAELQASTIGNIGQKLICRGRANAIYVTQPLSYIASPGDATLTSGLSAKLQVSGKSNALWFGADGTGTTYTQDALNDWLSRGDSHYLPAGTYSINGPLSKVGQAWSITGDGSFVSKVIATQSVIDILTLDAVATGASINRVNISGIHLAHETGDKQSGSLINAKGNLIGCSFSDIYFRNFYNMFTINGTAKTYFTNSFYDMFGRTEGTKGNFAFNVESTTNKLVDFHVDNLQGSGFTSGANSHGLMAHFNITSCDGLYVNNSHFFYGDTTIKMVGSGTGQSTTIASIKFSNSYFDTIRVNHVLFASAAGVTCKEFDFVGCTFRDCQEGASIQNSSTSDITSLRITGGSIRANFKSGILDSATSGDLINPIINGVTFEDNNSENTAVAGDIVTRCNGATINNNVFSGGGDIGRSVYLLSGADKNMVTGNNHSSSTTSVDIFDGGTLNIVSNNLPS